MIAVRANFHNFGLFLVWSANYGNFGYVDRTYFDPSIPFREWEVIIDQKNASNLTAPDMHTTPPSHTGLSRLNIQQNLLNFGLVRAFTNIEILQKPDFRIFDFFSGNIVVH